MYLFFDRYAAISFWQLLQFSLSSFHCITKCFLCEIIYFSLVLDIWCIFRGLINSEKTKNLKLFSLHILLLHLLSSLLLNF